MVHACKFFPDGMRSTRCIHDFIILFIQNWEASQQYYYDDDMMLKNIKFLPSGMLTKHVMVNQKAEKV